MIADHPLPTGYGWKYAYYVAFLEFGLSVSLLSQIERAESSASISSLYKIAVSLDTKITKLFGSF